MTEQVLSPRQAQTRPPLGAVLRYPSFVVLWLSEALSLIGDRLIMVALVILVYDRTGSAGAVGLLMLFKAVPALVLGSVAGVFVDRWNRKWIMVSANLLQGLLVFCLPLSPGITVVFIIYLAMATINQFFVPARSATIPDFGAARNVDDGQLAVCPLVRGLNGDRAGHRRLGHRTLQPERRLLR